MSRVVHLETECHVFVHHTVLVDDLDLLGWILLDFLSVIYHGHERVCCRYTIAILRVRKEDSYVFGKTLESV